jgi:hypothetical protein
MICLPETIYEIAEPVKNTDFFYQSAAGKMVGN